MDTIVIEPLKADDANEASVVLSRALSPTPLPCAVFGDPTEEQRRFLEQVMKGLIACPGQVLLAKEDKQVIGVMRIVEWPDCQEPPVQALALLPEEIVLRVKKVAIELGKA